MIHIFEKDFLNPLGTSHLRLTEQIMRIGSRIFIGDLEGPQVLIVNRKYLKDEQELKIILNSVITVRKFAPKVEAFLMFGRNIYDIYNIIIFDGTTSEMYDETKLVFPENRFEKMSWKELTQFFINIADEFTEFYIDGNDVVKPSVLRMLAQFLGESQLSSSEFAQSAGKRIQNIHEQAQRGKRCRLDCGAGFSRRNGMFPADKELCLNPGESPDNFLVIDFEKEKEFPSKFYNTERIYACHLLEHLSPEGIENFLTASYDILKHVPRGSINAVLPHAESKFAEHPWHRTFWNEYFLKEICGKARVYTIVPHYFHYCLTCQFIWGKRSDMLNLHFVLTATTEDEERKFTSKGDACIAFTWDRWTKISPIVYILGRINSLYLECDGKDIYS